MSHPPPPSPPLSLGGLIVAILNIITLAAGGSDVDLSAFMFFLCSLVALVICLVSYFYMPHLPVIAFHMVGGGGGDHVCVPVQ